MTAPPKSGPYTPRLLLVRLTRDSRRYCIYYIPIALGLVAGSIADLGVTDGLRRMVDAAAQRSYQLLWTAIALGVGGFVASSFLMLATNYLRAWVDQISGTARQLEMVGHVHRVHYDHVTGQQSGDLITRLISNAYAAQTGLNEAAISVVRHAANLIVTLAYLTYLNWQLAVGSLVMAALGPVVLNLMSGKLRQLWTQRWEQEGKLSALVQDTVQGAEVTRALRLRGWLLGRFDSRYREYLGLIRRTEVWNQLLNQIGMVMTLAGLFFALGYGGWLAARGVLTVGAVTAFLVSFERLNWPIQGLLQVWPNLQRSLSAAQRVYELLDEPSAPGVAGAGTGAGAEIPTFTSIEFDRVTFTYPGRGEAVLRELTLTIPAGKFTAIVGETGSGKTTILRLLLRFFDPDEGEIRLVGWGASPGLSPGAEAGSNPGAGPSQIPVSHLPLADWRRRLGYVPQEPILFDGTLEENIRLGDWQQPGSEPGPGTSAVQPANAPPPNAEEADERLWRAIRLAQLEDVIRRLPQGLATRVGERGARLSGGERQRVALARAAYRDPDILLLDEATSSLDNASEKMVQQALASLSAGRTTVAIAHRLSTVVGADQIIVIDQGRVLEVGTHAELLAAGGKYARLYAAGRLADGGNHGGESNGGGESKGEARLRGGVPA